MARYLINVLSVCGESVDSGIATFKRSSAQYIIYDTNTQSTVSIGENITFKDVEDIHGFYIVTSHSFSFVCFTIEEAILNDLIKYRYTGVNKVTIYESGVYNDVISDFAVRPVVRDLIKEKDTIEFYENLRGFSVSLDGKKYFYDIINKEEFWTLLARLRFSR